MTAGEKIKKVRVESLKKFKELQDGVDFIDSILVLPFATKIFEVVDAGDDESVIVTFREEQNPGEATKLFLESQLLFASVSPVRDAPEQEE